MTKKTSGNGSSVGSALLDSYAKSRARTAPVAELARDAFQAICPELGLVTERWEVTAVLTELRGRYQASVWDDDVKTAADITKFMKKHHL